MVQSSLGRSVSTSVSDPCLWLTGLELDSVVVLVSSLGLETYSLSLILELKVILLNLELVFGVG